jgi:predicted alpha/beta hydrolase family esterase
MDHTILILPGLYNSGPGHWQTIWETELPNARRVQQSNWDRPSRQDWVATLDSAIHASSGKVILAAHSLGCALTAWWASTCATANQLAKVSGTLLVALPDVEREDFPGFVQGFAPMPRMRLPFKAIVAASSNDPWCQLLRAQSWARDWGAEFHDIGPRGHINAESGLQSWSQGQRWLSQFQSE